MLLSCRVEVPDLNHDGRHPGVAPFGVVLASIEDHDVAGLDLDPQAIVPRHPSLPGQDDQQLPEPGLMRADGSPCVECSR